jgi:transcriptional regulator with XRE-family HTH domain
MDKQQKKTANLENATSADQFLAKWLSDAENERLYREAEIRFDLSEYMRGIRKIAGLRQEDLAKRVGCSQSFIAKLERGGYNRLGFDNLRTYARAIGHDINVSAMFFALPSPVYSGRSSYGELPDALKLDDLLTGRLASLSIETWYAETDQNAAPDRVNAFCETLEIGAAA